MTGSILTLLRVSLTVVLLVLGLSCQEMAPATDRESSTVGKTNAQPLFERHVRSGDKKKDGKRNYKITEILRDGALIYFETWDEFSKSTIRKYSDGNRDLVIELDRNNDGIFELIILFDSDNEVIAVLQRNDKNDVSFAPDDVFKEIKSGF